MAWPNLKGGWSAELGLARRLPAEPGRVLVECVPAGHVHDMVVPDLLAVKPGCPWEWLPVTSKRLEFVLDNPGVLDAAVGRPLEMDLDALTVVGEATYESIRRVWGDVDRLVDVFLDRQVELDLHCREGVEASKFRLPYRVRSVSDRDGNVTRVGVSFILEVDGRDVVVNLNAPAICALVLAGRQRPLRERVRIAGYLVGLCSEAVCFFGLNNAVFRDAIRLFRDLLRRVRDEQACDSGDGACASDGEADDGRPVHGSSPSVGGDASWEASGICTSDPTEGDAGPNRGEDAASTESEAE